MVFIQGFFSLRIYTTLPKPHSYTGLSCFFLSVVCFFGTVYLSVQAIIANTVTEFGTQWKPLVITLLAYGAVVDVALTVSLAYYLSLKRGEAHQT